MSYFPMFVDIKGKECLVVGGGCVALRKTRMLLDFGAQVTVVAPEITEELAVLPGIHLIKRGFKPEDIGNSALVTAASCDREVNHLAAACAKERGIPVNVADMPEEGTFIFPAYRKKGEVVGAFSGGGKSPVVARYLKEKTEPFFTKELGETDSYLGAIRDFVKENVSNADDRKKVYGEILERGLSGNCPSEEELQDIIYKIRQKERKQIWNERED